MRECAEAAAAADDRRDSLQEFFAVVWIAAELHVVVGVSIHESGRHNQPACVQNLPRWPDPADLDNPIPFDANVDFRRDPLAPSTISPSRMARSSMARFM